MPQPDLRFRRAVARDRHEAVDEISGRGRQRQRVPAQLSWAPGAPLAPTPGKHIALQRLEGAVQHRRPNSVQPGAPIRMPRRGKRGARQLLGIEPSTGIAAESFARAAERRGSASLANSLPKPLW